MRLPEYLSRISPWGRLSTPSRPGELALEQNITAENGRLSVASADRDGLSLWEADYGIEDADGLPLDVRRAKIRTAMSGAATLTPAYLRELCVTIGGADDGEVVEDFPHWAVQVRPVTWDRVDADTEILEESIRKLLPAHLTLELLPAPSSPPRSTSLPSSPPEVWRRWRGSSTWTPARAGPRWSAFRGHRRSGSRAVGERITEKTCRKAGLFCIWKRRAALCMRGYTGDMEVKDQ